IIPTSPSSSLFPYTTLFRSWDHKSFPLLIAHYAIPDIKIFRCLYRRCLPLPIPNREVKPARADGIAVTGGRVGRCLILQESPFRKLQGAFFMLTDVRCGTSDGRNQMWDPCLIFPIPLLHLTVQLIPIPLRDTGCPIPLIVNR